MPKKTSGILLVLLFLTTVSFAEQYFTNLRNVKDIDRAIKHLNKSSDFSYFVELASEKGIAIHRVTSNIAEPNYIFSVYNASYYWGGYNYTLTQLRKIEACLSKNKVEKSKFLTNIENQAFQSFEYFYGPNAKGKDYYEIKLNKRPYNAKMFKKSFQDNNNYIEVNNGNAALNLYFIKEHGVYRIRYFM